MRLSTVYKKDLINLFNLIYLTNLIQLVSILESNIYHVFPQLISFLVIYCFPENYYHN